jgi:hypothetical protein
MELSTPFFAFFAVPWRVPTANQVSERRRCRGVAKLLMVKVPMNFDTSTGIVTAGVGFRRHERQAGGYCKQCAK